MKLKLIAFLLVSLFLVGMTFSCAAITKGMQAVQAAGVKAKDSVKSSVDASFSNSAKAINTSNAALNSAFEEITPEQEYFIGRAVAANILNSYKLYIKSKKLTTYLNNICAAITINSPRPFIFKGYHVAMLDSKEINAFATSGGHIFVTRGIVNAAKSEDALAGVIAHEVAHIQLQHSIKAIKSSRFTQALLISGTATASAVSGVDVDKLTDIMNESVGDIVQTLVNNGYSQTQEYEADNTAINLLASAGYTPTGLLTMLESLAAVQKEGEGFGKTHPSPKDRINNAKRTLLLYGFYKDTSATRNKRFSAAIK